MDYIFSCHWCKQTIIPTSALHIMAKLKKALNNTKKHCQRDSKSHTWIFLSPIVSVKHHLYIFDEVQIKQILVMIMIMIK